MTSLAEALEAEHHFIDAELESFAAAVAAGTADAEAVKDAFELLRRHIYVEEEFLFPPLRSGGLMMAIQVMLREHADIWRQMDALEEMLEQEPASELIISACRTLLETLEAHNAKEEPIVYPEADKVIAEADATDLLKFLENGQMPEDWICRQI